MDKLQQIQIKFHLDRISILRRELDQRKTAGEKRIWKQQNELESELTRLEEQIKQHEEKIVELKSSL